MGAADSLVRDVLGALVALLSSGWAVSFYRDWRRRREGRDPLARESLHIAGVDRSVVVMERAMGQLEDDNARLRQEREQSDQRHAAERQRSDQRHAAERAEWFTERGRLREEIDQLESKLRRILEELSELKARHGMQT